MIWSRGIGTVSEDRAEALEEARTYAATVANALVRYARASTTLADRIPSHLLSVLEEVVAAYDYYEHEATGPAMPAR